MLTAVRSAARRGAGWAFSAVFPDVCRICDSPLEEISRVPVCRSCIETVPPIEAEWFCARCLAPFVNSRPLNDDGICGLCVAGLNRFDAAYAYGFYEGTLRRLIHLFKYDGMTPLAWWFGAMMSRTVPRDKRFDVVTPMPLHWWRRWRRGFNQAELLAREVGGRIGVPVVNAVKRKRGTAKQAGLTSSARRKNVAGAFIVSAPDAIAGRRVLLVDDVLTTGATVNACAAALKRAGAQFVAVVTLARADRRLDVTSVRSGSLGTESAVRGTVEAGASQ